MKKLPQIAWREPSQSSKESLQRWFVQRAADLGLRGAHGAQDWRTSDLTTSVASLARDKLSSHVTEFDPQVAVGDIRLLSSVLAPACPRPLYIAIIRIWDEKTFMAATFSPYSVPATRSELVLTERPQPLRVLSLWNARTLAGAVLSQSSWRIGNLAQTELDDAWSVFRETAAGHKLPPRLTDRVGPSIGRPDDPRIAYQSEEADFADHVNAMSQSFLDALSTPGSTGNPNDECVIITPDRAQPAIGMAAATHSVGFITAVKGAMDSIQQHGDSATADYEVVGMDASVRLFIDRAENELIVMVFDSRGAASDVLSGTIIMDLQGRILGKIHGNGVRLPLNQTAAGIILLETRGETLRVRKTGADVQR